MLDALLLFPRELDVTEVDGLLARHLVPEFTRASGLRSLRLSEGTVMSRGGPSPYSRVVEASFGSIAEWMADFARHAPLVVYFDVTEPRTPT